LPPFIPAYLSDSRAASKVEKNLNDMRKQITVLKKKFARILENPALHDPVFKVAKKAFSFRSPMNLKFCDPAKRDQIFERALRRFQRGLAPRKRDDTSLGDAINWEWVVECAIVHGMDIVVVSRDGDFGLRLDGKHYLNDSLQHEFKERVSPKRRVSFTTSLAQALKNLDIAVTKAEEEEERKIIAQPTAPSGGPPLKSIWDPLLNRVRQKSPFAYTYLKESQPVSFADKVLTIGFDSESADYLSLVDNAKNNALLKVALEEMGYEGCQISFVVLSKVEDEPTEVGTPDDDVLF
jgi:hypothetical protein